MTTNFKIPRNDTKVCAIKTVIALMSLIFLSIHNFSHVRILNIENSVILETELNVAIVFDKNSN